MFLAGIFLDSFAVQFLDTVCIVVYRGVIVNLRNVNHLNSVNLNSLNLRNLTSVLRSVACVGFIGLVGCSHNAEFQNQLRDLRAVQAEHTVRLDDMNQELRQLSGRVDELQHLVSGRTEKLEKALEQVTSRVPPPEGVPEDMLAEDEERINRISGEQATQYKNGLQQLRSGDFSAAQLTFSNFADVNPNTTFTDNALFWVGISLEKMGQYDRAVNAYSQVFQKYPAEDKVPYSLFRLGEVFAKMGLIEEAKLSLSKLINDHPKHKLAKFAQAKIKELGGGKKTRDSQ